MRQYAAARTAHPLAVLYFVIIILYSGCSTTIRALSSPRRATTLLPLWPEGTAPVLAVSSKPQEFVALHKSSHWNTNATTTIRSPSVYTVIEPYSNTANATQTSQLALLFQQFVAPNQTLSAQSTPVKQFGESITIQKLCFDSDSTKCEVLLCSVPSVGLRSHDQAHEAANFESTVDRLTQQVLLKPTATFLQTYLTPLYSAMVASQATFIPIPFRDCIHGDWVVSWSYKLLLFALELRLYKLFELQGTRHAAASNELTPAIPAMKLYFAVSLPPLRDFTFHNKEEKLSAQWELQKNEITHHIKETVYATLNRTLDDMMNNNPNAAKLKTLPELDKLFVIEVVYIPETADAKQLYKCGKELLKVASIGEDVLKSPNSSAYEIMELPNAWVKEFLQVSWKTSPLDSSLSTVPQIISVGESERIMLNIFKRYKNAVNLYPAAFHTGLDLEFGSECDELIKNALEAYDEEACNLPFTKHLQLYRKHLQELILSDLQNKYDAQVQKLRVASMHQFRNAIDKLQLTPSINKQLTTAIRSIDESFVTNARSLKGKLAGKRFSEHFARFDLLFSMREIANTVLEFARLNGLYTAEKLFRKPISLSFHYLSPNAFGLSDYSRVLSGEPDKSRFTLNPSTMLSSVDPRLNKKNNVLIPYDVPIDVQLLADSMVYDSSKK